MKTKLVFFFVLLATFCNAQSWLKLNTFNLEDVRQISDSIAQNAREPFKLKSEGIPEDNRIYYVLTYLNTADAGDSIVVMFLIHTIGGPQDAVSPTAQYVYTRTTGKFTNLFPFWNKFMKSTAVEANVLDKTKDEAIVKGATFDFHVESTYWAIEKF